MVLRYCTLEIDVPKGSEPVRIELVLQQCQCERDGCPRLFIQHYGKRFASRQCQVYAQNQKRKIK